MALELELELAVCEVRAGVVEGSQVGVVQHGSEVSLRSPNVPDHLATSGLVAIAAVIGEEKSVSV